MAYMRGIVKQVINGDTFVLVANVGSQGPPPQKQLSLISVLCPKTAMKSLNVETQDEPFAWEAREFMRKMLIGQDVEFKVEHSMGEKESGTIKFNGANVAIALIKAGLAKVRGGKSPPCSPDIEEFLAVEVQAKDAKLKIWSDVAGVQQNSIRDMTWAVGNAELCKKFFHENKNTKLPAVVEYVRDGGCIRATFTKQNFHATILLSGVLCDGFKREMTDGIAKLVSEPFAEETKFFVEFRILNRDMAIRLESLDDTGDLYGSVYHPRGNIATFLLREGLARVSEWSLRLSEDSLEMREAQRDAQKRGVKRWVGFEPPTLSCQKKFEGLVSEIVSGDCIVVQTPSGEAKKFFLSSLRCPRCKTKTREEEPWAFEAKEMLRKKLIGRKVNVEVDYTRDITTTGQGFPAQGAAGEEAKMMFASIFVADKNVAHLLLQAGLAKTIAHRQDDQRAPDYDELVEFERAAQARAIGVFSPEKNAPKHRINDLCGAGNSARAKAFEAQLSRLPKINGVVEYIFNGGRYKIRLPSENLAISFCVGGLRCPQTGRGGVEGEAYSEEGARLARESLMQRDVSITIQQVDRGGNFIGSLRLNNVNFALTLLEKGYAQTMAYSLRFVSEREELLAAEAKAVENRIGLWGLEGATDTLEEQKEATCLQETFENAQISHINGITDFFFNLPVPSDSIQSQIANLDYKEPFTPGGLPKLGQIVLARFHLDQQYYRAKIASRFNASHSCTVSFIDYGNCEQVCLEELAHLPPSFSSPPPQAHHCTLAGLAEPPDFEAEAASLFEVLTENLLHIRAELLDKNKKKHVVLTPPSGLTINEEIIRSGLARLDKNSTTSILACLKKEEEYARKKHINLWRHGDVGDDEDDYPPATAFKGKTAKK